MPIAPAQGLARLWSVPLAGRTAVVAAALLAFPFCFTGIFMDDYAQQLVLEGQMEVPMSRWELFAFAFGDPARLEPLVVKGPYPWWTLPELKFAFVRPLSVALAQLDHWLFGRAYFWHHLHSVVWYVLLVAVATALLRRALGRLSPVAAIAAVLFAVSGTHGMPAGWLANRNALVATLPALLGVLAHVRWREQKTGWALPASLLGYAVGLSGSEAALGALAYLAAYELTAGPGPWRTRLLSLAPAGVVGASYLALYLALGAGTYGSDMYVDPLAQPLTFLWEAPAKALALAGAQFFTISSQLSTLGAGLRLALAITGALALALVTLLLRRLWPSLEAAERRGARWLALGAALSVLPVLATLPMDRLLLMPSLGASGLLALLFFHGARTERDRALRLLSRLLFVTSVLFGVGAWPLGWVVFRMGGDLQTRTALDTNFTDAALAGRVVVFVAPDPLATVYLHRVRVFNGKPRASAWLTVSFAPYAHRLTRTAPDEVELEVLQGRMLEGPFERLLRSSAFPVREGMQRRLDGVTVTVVGLDQGLPSRVRLRFDHDPEGADYTLAQFVDGKLSPLTLPPVGQSIELPRLRGLFSP